MFISRAIIGFDQSSGTCGGSDSPSRIATLTKWRTILPNSSDQIPDSSAVFSFNVVL